MLLDHRLYLLAQTRELCRGKFNNLHARRLELIELPPAEIARLREKVQPVVKKHSEGVPEATLKELYAEIEKVRGQK